MAYVQVAPPPADPVSDWYGRKSTSDKGRSAARQERDWLADCEREGLTPGRRFVDPDLSASRYATKDRPDFAALVEHIRSGACRMIAMWEASRGSREIEEWIRFLKLCRKQGVLIRIYGGNDPRTFDVRKRRDWRILVEEGVDAHDESELLSERVRDGVRDAAAQGKPYGKVQYGYQRVYDTRGRFVEQVKDPVQSAVIRKMVEDTFAGVPMNTQARALNKAGVSTPTGIGEWHGNMINRLLRKPSYVAIRRHVTKDESGVEHISCYPGDWPAIIEPDEHRRLLEILEAPDRRNFGDGSALKYQLVNAAQCTKCDGSIGWTGGNRNDRRLQRADGRYRCAACYGFSAPRQPIDDLVDRLLTARLRRKDALTVFAPRKDNAAIAAVRAAKEVLEDRLADAKREWKAGRISAASFGEFERDMAPQIEEADGRLRDLSTPPVLHGLDPIEIAGNWPAVPVGVRREIILAFADIRFDPIGRGRRWSPWTMGQSRWHGDELTWGEHWGRSGEVPG